MTVAEKEKSDLLVSINEPVKQFRNHLKPSNNHRILFTAPFGTGKTTFLKKFFENNDKYEVFHLFPVNYQVEDNKDIFELLKYDILCELIPKIQFDEEKDSNIKDKSIALQYLLLTQGANLALSLLKQLPKLGKVISSFEAIIKFCSDLGKRSKTKEDDLYEELDKFSKLVENKSSIYEIDPISNLIAEQVQRINKEEKETILIIDDLDRVDPKHIFRLLNVFSAHFDQDYSLNNKFGFSKIILVCDIKNIEIIYRSMYGQEVDFSGYIDKFWSIENFQFRNEENWISSFNRVFSNMNKSFFFDYGLKEFGVYLIKDLVRNNLLNCRKILKIYNNHDLFDPLKEIRIEDNTFYIIERLPIFSVYKLLYFFYDGNLDQIIKVLEKLTHVKDSELIKCRDKSYLKHLIQIIHLFHKPQKTDHKYEVLINGKKISYDTNENQSTIMNIFHETQIVYEDIYHICKEAFSIINAFISLR